MSTDKMVLDNIPFELDAERIMKRVHLRAETWEIERYYFLLMGILSFAGVSFMRYRFSWWPLSPIGMVVWLV